MKIINSIKEKLKLLYTKADTALSGLVPSSVLRKVMIYFICGFIILFILILFVGITLRTRQSSGQERYVLNKPKITQPNPTPRVAHTQIQKELEVLEMEINKLNFPDSLLSRPGIATELSVE